MYAAIWQYLAMYIVRYQTLGKKHTNYKTTHNAFLFTVEL